MFERRVVRGNTHGSYVLSKEDEYLYKLNQNANSKHLGAKKPAVSRTVQDAYQNQELDKSASWADKRATKLSKACFTEKQFIYETDLPPCHDATTQTDFVIVKEIPGRPNPNDPKLKEKPNHKETQIYPNEPPFDFNYEAEPIVQVLMTRILEESRVEVLEEEELLAMKNRQEHLLAHKAEVKRKLEELEEKEKQMVKANVGLPYSARKEK